MEFCISSDQLRAALKDIEKAEAAGFMYCLSVFKLVSAGAMLDACLANYSDLLEKAHPTDGNLNWGRFQGVHRSYKFDGNKLVVAPIVVINPPAANAAQDVRNQTLEEAAKICDRFAERRMHPSECAGAIRALKTLAKREE